MVLCELSSTNSLLREWHSTTTGTKQPAHPGSLPPRTSVGVGFQPLHKMSAERAVWKAQDREGAATKCGGCAWTILRSSSCSFRSSIPGGTRVAFMSATMTALQKPDGRATGTSFRRLVAKALARQFSKQVEATCSPFQFAVSTRAGTDYVGSLTRTRQPQCCPQTALRRRFL